MADPPAQHQQDMPPQSAPTASSAPVSHAPTTASHFPYPHMYLDPVAAAAAFYQHAQTNPPNSQQQQQQQHPPQPAAPTTQPQQQQQQPYYMHDSTNPTAALQQMHQLQMQLQLHLQTQSHHLLPHTTAAATAASATTQPQSSHQSPSPLHFLAPAHHPQSLLPPHPAAANLPNSSIIHHHSPFVPESQMMSAYRIGRYTPAERRIRLERYREKRAQRNYNRRVKYDCRKMIADKRRRVQGRFVKREEEIALAIQHNDSPHLPATEDGTEDGTEDDTKVHHPESSGSASSTRPLDAVNLDPAQRVSNPSFCEQSDQVLQFR